jgi:acyl carrier protein
VLPRQQDAATSLVAFLVVDDTVPLADDPAAWLARRLPRIMVPRHFQRVADIPLMPGGKVDGNALLAALAAPEAADAPRDTSDTIRFLTATWAALLRVPPPGSDADFFGLGGDSLALLELAAVVERETGRQFSADAFLKTPTIAALARLLKPGADSPPAGAPPPNSPAGGRFDARGKLVLRRIREARGASRGIVLGMPGFLGHAALVATIAAHTFHDHDVWAFTVDLDGRTMHQDEAWYACAQEIAEILTTETWLRPRAVFGFSAGGYISWLVDRMLSGASWRPGRVINFDSGPLHTARDDWHERVDALVPQDHRIEPAQMLLLHRRMPAPFALVSDLPARWSKLDVALQTIGFRTVDHMDMTLPSLVAAAADAMAAFVETGRIAPLGPHQDAMVDTPGGRLHDMLNRSSPPDPAQVSALVNGKALPDDGSCQLALLFLAIAVCDPPTALDVARRITQGEPRHRAATYAQVALLSLGGDKQAAASLAAAWCCGWPDDPPMRARAARPWQPPQPWDSLNDVVVGSDDSLDHAIDMMAARLGHLRH